MLRVIFIGLLGECQAFSSKRTSKKPSPKALPLMPNLYLAITQRTLVGILHLTIPLAFRRSPAMPHLARLPTSLCVSLRRTEQLTIKEARYYIPCAANEAAIDSLLLHDGDLYPFQFTTGSTDDIKPGLQNVLNRFTGLLPQKDWRFIFIVPDDLEAFSYPHSNKGFLLDHIPFSAQVATVTYYVAERFRMLKQKNGGTFGLLFEAHMQQAFAKGININAKPIPRSWNNGSRWHSTFSDFSTKPNFRRGPSQCTAQHTIRLLPVYHSEGRTGSS
ncbi:hypothetical protein BU17DRAFT_64647 [Hysterangium stoloniferum]|nr:hypothetical protein BU17DRAFT_64647 [Hysterangium stoloniferum]